MGADGIGFLGPARVAVDPDRPLCARTNAIAPVVVVGVAAAGPAHHRHMQILERADDVLAPAADVRDGRGWSDPDAAVDAAAQIFGGLAVDVLVDVRAG